MLGRGGGEPHANFQAAMQLSALTPNVLATKCGHRSLCSKAGAAGPVCPVSGSRSNLHFHQMS